MFAHCTQPSRAATTVFSLLSSTRSGTLELANTPPDDDRNPARVFQFVIFVWFPARWPFCSRQNQRGLGEIKAGDDAKVEGSCNDEGVKLAIVGSDASKLRCFQAQMLSKATSTIWACSTNPSQWLHPHTHVLALYLLLECTQITYFKAGGIL